MRVGHSIATFSATMLTMIAFAAPARAQVSEQTFRGGRTSDLAALCAADPAVENGIAARAWCHGFIIGAGQYHTSLAAADPARERLFCLPEPTPTLDEARGAFVAWARANPQFSPEKAIDGLMRFAVATWPCPPAAPPRSRRR
jgi:hypothetical protein